MTKRKRRQRPNPMKWIIIIVVAAIVAYTVVLLIGDNGQFAIPLHPEQEYVTAEVDSSITRRQMQAPPEVDTILVPSRQLLVARMDSDSVHVSLDRPLQEIVTIDLEEHKEHVFFTWEDIKAYFSGVVLTIEQYKNKHHNDHH